MLCPSQPRARKLQGAHVQLADANDPCPPDANADLTFPATLAWMAVAVAWYKQPRRGSE